VRFPTDFLTFFFLLYCVLYNAFLSVYFIGLKVLRKRSQGGLLHPVANREWPVITVMVPALNEEQVIRNTVERLLALPYPGVLEVLIIDDHSDDRTPEITAELQRAHANVDVLHRGVVRSHLGKGDSLNHGVTYLRAHHPNRDPDHWVIGVFDADGRPVEDDMWLQVGQVFVDPKVGAAQCGVRIRNGRHLLAALQDVEFATFSFVTQTVRDHTSGAVALGGNGQFIRASVLEQLSRQGACWDEAALTEDLDIGIRVHLAGWDVRFLDRWVEQEGVETARALFRQRHRWAWGTLQVFLRYVLGRRLWHGPMSLGKRLDLHYYLSFWIVPFVVLGSFLLSLLDLAGVITITNRFGLTFLLANSFSFIPMIVLGLAWAKVPVRRMVYLVPLTVIYAYHWIPVLILGWVSIIRHKRPKWVKTQRYAMEEPMKEERYVVKEPVR